MIIPVKCFTCGNVIANKYEYYLAEVRKLKMSRGMDTDKVIYLTKEYIHKTPEGEVMDQLKLNKMCCRRHFLTHVDIEWNVPCGHGMSHSIFSSSNDMLMWLGKCAQLVCRSSSTMERHTDNAVYLNACGMIPCMHAAMDPHNNLADVHMHFRTCVTQSLNNECFMLQRTSAFV